MVGQVITKLLSFNLRKLHDLGYRDLLIRSNAATSAGIKPELAEHIANYAKYLAPEDATSIHALTVRSYKLWIDIHDKALKNGFNIHSTGAYNHDNANNKDSNKFVIEELAVQRQ